MKIKLKNIKIEYKFCNKILISTGKKLKILPIIIYLSRQTKINKKIYYYIPIKKVIDLIP